MLVYCSVSAYYLTISVIIAACILCCEVYILNIYHNCSGRPLPDCARRLLSKRFSCAICCLPHRGYAEDEVDGTSDNNSYNSSFSTKDKSDDSRRSSEKNPSPSSFQKALSSSLWDHKPKAVLAPVGCTAEELGTFTAVDQAAAEQLAAETRRCLVEKTTKPEKHKSRQDYDRQWQLLAIVLDRIFFLVFLVLTLLNTLFGLLLPCLLQT